jgi:hypothetical protein
MTTMRDQFIFAFMAAMALLYGMNTADIRIKPLGETHESLFVNLALAVHAYARRQASQKAEKEAQDRPGASGQKPPHGQK